MASTVRIVWMLAASAFVGGGVGLVWWPTSQTIAAVQSQAKALYDEADANEAEVRRAAELRALAKRMADDVRALSGQGSQSAVVAATLTLLNRETHNFKIEVRSIVPTTPAAKPDDRSLMGTPIEIDVRGHFRDLLAFVSDLPRHNVLIDVSDVNLDDDSDRSLKPVLNAKIHAIIFRYRGAEGEETQHASRAL
jgi:Tfp pilus assembly protein PilO